MDESKAHDLYVLFKHTDAAAKQKKVRLSLCPFPTVRLPRALASSQLACCRYDVDQPCKLFKYKSSQFMPLLMALSVLFPQGLGFGGGFGAVNDSNYNRDGPTKAYGTTLNQTFVKEETAAPASWLAKKLAERKQAQSAASTFQAGYQQALAAAQAQQAQAAAVSRCVRALRDMPPDVTVAPAVTQCRLHNPSICSG